MGHCISVQIECVDRCMETWRGLEAGTEEHSGGMVQKLRLVMELQPGGEGHMYCGESHGSW